MKVTVENWSLVQEKILKPGIKDTQYDPTEALQTIITKGGEGFYFSADIVRQFQMAGLTKLGTRIERNKY